MPSETTPFQNVDRIPAPSAEVFRREYVAKQRPVILQGLFAGQAIDAIRTEEDAVRMFGSLQLPIANEALAALDEAAPGESLAPPELMTLADYLEFSRLHPGTKKMCSEKPTPRELLGSFRLPDYDNYNDAISSFFVGNAGNYAHMHFDCDFRHVLFHQLFGVKRFILVPPRQGEKLAPIGNNAWWSIEKFSEEDKRRFVEFTGAYDCLLHPGETLLMPACIWHYVEYVTSCMSCNFRFGRNEYTRSMASVFHPSRYLQNIAWRMTDETAAKEKYSAAFEELMAAYREPAASGQEKYEAMERVFRKVCGEICPDYPVADYGINDPGKLSAFYATGSADIYARALSTQKIALTQAAAS